MKALLAGLMVAAALSLDAGAQAPDFGDPALEQRFRALTSELRCLVCQNQNIADSRADLALDLRRQVDAMLRAGESDEAILEFMVDRYGEFVLYRPRFSLQNLALWLGPFLAVLGGLALLLRYLRRRAAAASTPVLAEDDRARLEALLAASGPPASSGNDEPPR